ncbi:FadR/GntR family transcriptional regulator [Corallococcus sp. EGB]|uniref:FadR/GntR family transcriptional regulator n=1 Tax=Corallococcus sp. EGB TaxID=1521117 RepID=UPI001CBDE6C7|nr:GntR family transcriptional regulator [Corallococcus sp. EGB]
MEMGRGGLVAYVETELERDIALGRLPPCGQFPSEAELARRMKVCRGTMREALRRLAARGLVVQRSGRKTRAVPLDESLTLENLGLALHDARSPEARWLLEGYFSLRRQVMVELLVDCCVKASERDLDSLGRLCFGLWDAAKWESGEQCAQVEFELLRLAARVAERPGHVLLVQSLHRAFLGGPARLLSFMEGEALRQWVICATDALRERDTRALQQDLPTLMKACDERLLEQFAPAPSEPASLEALRVAPHRIDAPVSAPTQDEAQESLPRVEERAPGRMEPVAELGRALEAASGVGAWSPGGGAPSTEVAETLGVAQDLHSEAPDSRPRRASATTGPSECETLGECATTALGVAPGTLADSRTDGVQPEASPTCDPEPGHMVRGPRHGIQNRLVRWTARLWGSVACTLGARAHARRAHELLAAYFA